MEGVSVSVMTIRGLLGSGGEEEVGKRVEEKYGGEEDSPWQS